MGSEQLSAVEEYQNAHKDRRKEIGDPVKNRSRVDHTFSSCHLINLHFQYTPCAGDCQYALESRYVRVIADIA